MSYSVRRGAPEDLREVQRLSQALFDHSSSGPDAKFLDRDWAYHGEGKAFLQGCLGPSKDHVCFVAEDGKLVGVLTGEVKKTEAWRPLLKLTELATLFVGAEHQGKGIGSKLVEEFIGWSKESGAHRVVVNAYAWNSAGIEFYQKHGFEPWDLDLERAL